jgi:uncharacterized membrane protein YedE/YeeE
MLLPNRMKNSRILMPIGTMCLALGLLLLYFLHPSAQSEKIVFHFVGGFLLGASIVFNFWAARLRGQERRCGN